MKTLDTLHHLEVHTKTVFGINSHAMDDCCDCCIGKITGQHNGFISEEQRYREAKARMAASGHATDTANPTGAVAPVVVTMARKYGVLAVELHRFSRLYGSRWL